MRNTDHLLKYRRACWDSPRLEPGTPTTWLEDTDRVVTSILDGVLTAALMAFIVLSLLLLRVYDELMPMCPSLTFVAAELLANPNPNHCAVEPEFLT